MFGIPGVGSRPKIEQLVEAGISTGAAQRYEELAEPPRLGRNDSHLRGGFQWLYRHGGPPVHLKKVPSYSRVAKRSEKGFLLEHQGQLYEATPGGAGVA